jgi:hypothetical protein
MAVTSVPQVRLDHPRVVEDLGGGALGDHRPELEGHHRSHRPDSSGMSCSMTRIDAPVTAWTRLQQRAERLGLLLGHAAGRLVEDDHRGSDASRPASSTIRRGAGGELAGELLAEGARGP